MYISNRFLLFIKGFLLLNVKIFKNLLIRTNFVILFTLFSFLLLFYTKTHFFTIDLYNNSCSPLLKGTESFCSYIDTLNLYIMLPELIIYGLIFIILFVRLRRSFITKEYFVDVRFLYILIPYLILRISTFTISENVLINFFHTHYYLVWEIWFWILLVWFVLIVNLDKEDIQVKLPEGKIIPPTKTNKGIDINDTTKIIESILPAIFWKIMYSNFKKVSFDSEWNKVGSLFKISKITQEDKDDDKYFVVFDLHPNLHSIVTEFPKYDWTLGINSFGSLKWFKSATWKSELWQNGLMLHVSWETISFKKLYNFPFLLEKSPLMKNPLDVMIWKNEKWKDIICDLAICPHLLIAWATGKWKSVWLQNILVSLMKSIISWVNIEIYIIDPKRVDYSRYKGLAHIDVVGDLDKWLERTKYLVAEMLRRYHVLENAKVENIKEYNLMWNKMSYKVLFVDEFADLMSQWWDVKKDFEWCIKRLWQMARACWIHIVLWTQRPDKDIVTWLIKANIPSVLWFWVVDKTNSRIILWNNLLDWIREIWEAYLSIPWMRKEEHVKTYFVDKKTELVEFLKYYDSSLNDFTNKNTGIPVHQNGDNKNTGIPVHQNGDNKIHTLHQFEEALKGSDWEIDVFSHSFAIFRELFEKNWYKNRNELFKFCQTYWISNSLVLKLINSLKSKDLIYYNEVEKRNKLVEDINFNYLITLYKTIYLVINK